MSRLHVNGKWLEQRLTGTQRYANEIVRAIDSLGAVELVVHVPSGAVVPDWLSQSSNVRIRTAPVKGVVFEQLYLPIVTAGRLLLNFAGPAPIVKRRQLVTMHDATPFRYPQTFTKAFVTFYRVAYTVLGRTARQLVTVSHFSARELDETLGIPVRRFAVVGCAADALAHVAPTAPAFELVDPFYLVVGTVAVHKNLTAPVAALAASGRTVVVVGASGNQQAFSAASSLPKETVIAGHLTDAELAWLYRNAKALVFPSKYEGFGLPPLEAQKLGCPVVTSSAGSLPEVVGDAGLYFDPDDPTTLLDALTELESSDGLAGDLKRRGFINAERFSWRASAILILQSLGIRVPQQA